MHTVAFEAKRVWHSFLRVARRPLLQWPGLTGARFDMMSALLAGEFERPRCVDVRQYELRRKLGVGASVVSRMVRALEKRGWVSRERDPGDRRTWLVSLTVEGERVIRAARRLLLRAMERLVAGAMEWLAQGTRLLFHAMVTILGYLYVIRLEFGDRATLDYPWWHTPLDH